MRKGLKIYPLFLGFPTFISVQYMYNYENVGSRYLKNNLWLTGKIQSTMVDSLLV